MILPRSLGVPVALLVALMTTTVTYTEGIGAAPGEFFGDPSVLVLGPEGGGLPGQAYVDLARVGPLRGIEGVRAVSPEVYIVVELGTGSAFVRGVEFEDFLAIEDADLVEGRLPVAPREALLGESYAARAGLAPGDDLLLPSGYERYAERIQVVGTFSSSGPSREEIVVNISLAQKMMDMPPGAGHLIRVRTDAPGQLTPLLESAGPTFTYSNVRISATDVVVGQPMVMRASLTNWGAVAGTKDVNVYVGERLTASRAYLVPARSTIPVEVPFLVDATGVTTVRVNPTFNLTAREPTLQIVDLPPRLVTGSGYSLRVLDLRGAPVAGVRVQAGDSAATTDADGNATLPPPPPGTLTILAIRDGRTEAAIEKAVDPADAPREARIVIRRFAPVEPVASVRDPIEIDVEAENVGVIAGTTTFQVLVDGAPAGEFALSAPAGGHGATRARIGPLAAGPHLVEVAEANISFDIRAYPGDDARIEALLAGYAEPSTGGGATTTEGAEQFITRVIGDVRAAVVGLAVASSLLVGLGLFAVLRRHVAERAPRVGILRSIGARREQVLAMATKDAARIGALGALAGIGLGCAASLALDATGIVWAFGHSVHPRFDWYSLSLLFLFACGVVLLGTRVLLLQAMQDAPDEMLRDRALRPLADDPVDLRDALEGRA